jgi:hypothetical protein
MKHLKQASKTPAKINGKHLKIIVKHMKHPNKTLTTYV